MKRVIVSDGKAYIMDEQWITIGGEDEDGSGKHVLINSSGTIVAGFGKGRNVKNAFGGSEKSDKSSGSKYESKARESVEYWLKTHYKTESDKNIKESVESVRSQMEHRVKSAEKNLRDAKGTGKPELIKKFQDKYDEAKGELDALNKYYDGGTVRKADTPEKANEAVKNKYSEYGGYKAPEFHGTKEEIFKQATENVKKAEAEKRKLETAQARKTLKDIDKRIAQAKADGDGKRVIFLEATKNRAEKTLKANTSEKPDLVASRAKYEKAFKEYEDLTDKNSKRNFASEEERQAAIKKAKENVSKAEKEHLTNIGFLNKKERLDTPEKANAAVKAKPKAGATYTDASAKFKNVAHRLDIDGSKSTDAYKYAQRLTKAAEKGGEDAVKNEIEKIKKTIDSTGDKTLKGLRKEHLDYVLEKAYGKKLDTAAKRYKDLVDTGGTYYAYSTNGRIGTLRDKIDRLSRQLKKAPPEKAGGIKERLDKAKELRATLIKEREDAFSKIKNAPKLKNEEYYNKKVERFEKLAKRREEETGNYFDPRAERLRDRAQRMRTLRYMSFIQKENRE